MVIKGRNWQTQGFDCGGFSLPHFIEEAGSTGSDNVVEQVIP
jgi:hypothetical protein